MINKKNQSYCLSKNLTLDVSSDAQDNIVILNKVTGNRVRITEETLKLLREFKSETNSSKLLRRLGVVDQGHKRKLLAVIGDLVLSDVLIPCLGEKMELEKLAHGVFIKPRQTFLNAPYLPESEHLIRTGIMLCGLPVDFATTGCPGARFGPEKFREVSARFVHYDQDIFTKENQGWYSMTSHSLILKGVPVYDVGDISYELSEDPHSFFGRCSCMAMKLFGQKKLPVFVGGDHSITASLVNACHCEYPDMTIVHVDAHTDLADWYQGRNHNHGNVMSRILAEHEGVQIFQYGLRGFAGAKSSDSRIKQIPIERMRGESFLLRVAEMPRRKKCYVTLDIDSMDPAYAPGTGTPVPFGLSPTVALRLLEQISRSNDIVGIDIVEVNPMRDIGDTTTSLAFHVLMEFLGYLFPRW